jgi:hypothetical protein
MYIRSFLSDSMQPSVPHVFSSVLADLRLWIRVLRKEVMAQGVLGRGYQVR